MTYFVTLVKIAKWFLICKTEVPIGIDPNRLMNGIPQYGNLFLPFWHGRSSGKHPHPVGSGLRRHVLVPLVLNSILFDNHSRLHPHERGVSIHPMSKEARKTRFEHFVVVRVDRIKNSGDLGQDFAVQCPRSPERRVI